MKTMTVHFTVTLSGSGSNIHECWNDAVEGLYLEPGTTPEDDYKIVEEDDDEMEEEEENKDNNYN